MGNLTDAKVKAELGKRTGRTRWLVESRGRGRGSLTLKVSGDSAHWYYRYTKEKRRSVYLPIGPYPKTTVASAREAADEYAAQLHELRKDAPTADLREHKREQERQRLAREETKRHETEAKQRAEVEAKRYTLTALFDTYCEHLVRQEKIAAAKNARGVFNRHVKDPFPEIAAAPARNVNRRQLTTVLRRVVQAGKGRTAGKLRSFLRAAYALALRAEGDATAPAVLIAFNIEHNPAADTAALTEYNRARDRALTEAELRGLWKRLKADTTLPADVVRLLFLLGGQRASQLLRAQVHDYDPNSRTITLYDPKGRRKQPRVHVLPVVKPAAAILDRLVTRAENLETKLLISSRGDVPLTLFTVSKFVRLLSAEIVTANGSEPFNLQDLRRTTETQLARMGISSDLRAQIQSHGLGGVQARHYDRHDYMKEKRVALEGWHKWLEKKPAKNVRGIREKYA
ncbi:tyrosine-type recombinase/integrase [Thiohalomonas denitrificans]|uniref:Phage integrase family protein n=1 Tax=Thiohalomonas denitrificans TaxID=415747 RepID=A0A1G5PTY7_9GAMM|nr:integrase family protein [Thiohalomonas denitrificans]SCZ52877.1 Phage integrase family protein [Thiohalomonas denitrificans]